jgi:hypothetical protein
MCLGIDQSKVFVACITKKYMQKVGGTKEDDNCKKEFNYAAKRKTAGRMLPVIMEKCMGNQSEWEGALGMTLGQQLYCPLALDGADFETQANKVVWFFTPD